jgi:UDP-GlcNAc:undecaprenyl-phosphate/decaprenyl-phosphate GlcNAc-1-phosphate transferase
MDQQIPYWILFVVAIPSGLLAWLSMYWIRRRADRWGLVDKPNNRKVHTEPTPMGGGLGIWLAVMSTFAAATVILLADDLFLAWIPASIKPYLDGFREQLGSLWVLLLSGTVLMVLGLIDDIRGLSWKLRLTVQCLVALVCVMSQQWYLTAFIPFKVITILGSVFWIVMLINSFNMLDNMDAASAGVAVISSLMLVLYVIIPGATPEGPQLFVAGFLMVFVGALLGFLWHNRPPARIFMGDAGSYFVGFCIAIATLLATYTDFEGSGVHAIIAPVIIMAVPIYDLVTVMVIRIIEGRSLFKPDKSHFSHRLVELGLSRSRAILTMYLTTATTGLAAILLPQVDLFGSILIVLMTFCVLSLIAILENTARSRQNTDLGD